VLDTIINDLSSLARDRAPVMVAQALVGIDIILDVVIPSTSAKAAISMPILWPIAQLTGVSGQTTVLAYLSTGRVPYATWIRFILPLWLVLLVLSAIAAAGRYGSAIESRPYFGQGRRRRHRCYARDAGCLARLPSSDARHRYHAAIERYGAQARPISASAFGFGATSSAYSTR
jgi:C4-dicarboxylate anaerobic carrier